MASECRSCVNRIAFGVSRAIDDVLAAEDIHIGNESHGYKIARSGGITTVTFSFCEAEPGEHPARAATPVSDREGAIDA